MSSESRIPSSTYRLQLGPALGFDSVAELCPYLAELGVSHVYLSPCLQAEPGSTHGYDVVDPTRVSEDLGGSEAFERMCEKLLQHDLGLVIDIVPNHMSIERLEHNRWFWDVLENGPESAYASHFDIDWRRPEDSARRAVVLPILGDHYERVLKSGAIRLEAGGAGFVLRVYDRVLPLRPGSVAHLRGASATQLNYDSRELHELLESQHYRLVYWKQANEVLNYRRFFDINHLVALRMENEEVFESTHELLLTWVKTGKVTGLRVDHPDGLLDPSAYFRRLRNSAPAAWIVAEKILEGSEELPHWPIDGTTGYDFLNRCGGLFVDPGAEATLTDFYFEFTQTKHIHFDSLLREQKRHVLQNLLRSDLLRVGRALLRVCDRRQTLQDLTLDSLTPVLEELLVGLPVYRTYVRAGTPLSERDKEYIDVTLSRARQSRPELDRHLLAFLSELLYGKHSGEAEAEFLGRFQQLSGPIMAKGLEDTAFYRFHRLVCLNEVGGDPGRFGTNVNEFHRHCGRIQKDWPATMLTTSTHDTKRSEDTRIRIALISEVPERWMTFVRESAKLNERHRNGGPWPDRGMEYLLYQTLVGAWPLSEERLSRYLLKAAREAKQHTSWMEPNSAYEEALQRFVTAVHADRAFVHKLEAFLEPLGEAAKRHALSQALLKFCVPGVPDIYQGNELFDHSLTDPDNRRPVDFARRERLLRELKQLSFGQVLARAEEGLPKLWITHKALTLRRRRPSAFGMAAEYRPLFASGRYAAHVVSFVREGQVAVVAPRLSLAIDDWQETTLPLPAGTWRNVLTDEHGLGGPLLLQNLFASFPVALLERV